MWYMPPHRGLSIKPGNSLNGFPLAYPSLGVVSSVNILGRWAGERSLFHLKGGKNIRKVFIQILM